MNKPINTSPYKFKEFFGAYVRATPEVFEVLCDEWIRLHDYSLGNPRESWQYGVKWNIFIIGFDGDFSSSKDLYLHNLKECYYVDGEFTWNKEI